jgi:tRNA U34 5-carboxymethylaminomethyl modifying GTPase MnmE/TrmE
MSETTAEPNRDLLLAKAARLSEIARHLGLERLSTTIESDTRRRLDDARVRVAMLGEIKQGKSTLINAIIGTDALPTGVTPTTGAVVLVHTGDTPGPYLHHGDDRVEPLDPERFSRLARGRVHDDSETPDEHPGILEYIVPAGTLPPALELVDTPGINDIARFRSAVSRGELPRADILVVVLDATQLLNRTEMAFLRDAIAAVGGLDDASGARLLVAVNRIDLIAERERPKLVEHLARELAGLAPERADGSPVYELFLTDARTALREPDSATSGAVAVRSLRARLLELTLQRSRLLPLRARASLLRHDALLAHNAAVAARAITLELESLRREIKAVEHEIRARDADMTALRAQMAQARERLLDESKDRLDGFRESVRRGLSACIDAASLRTLSSHLPGSIHDAYLAFAQQESERLRTALDEVTRRAILTHSEQVRRRLFHATMRLGFRGPTVYLDPPSVALEAGMVAIGVAGTAVMYFGNLVAGMVMTIAGPLATVVLRERSLRDARIRAKAELPGALERANEALREQLREVIDGQLAALDEHLLLANVALGEQLTAVLHHAAAELGAQDGSEDPSPDTVVRRRGEAGNELQALELELAQIRHELQTME